MIERKKRNSSKVNLTLSLVFHSALVLAVVFFAAREGILGNKLRQITVTMVPKEKKPEPPKEKPAEPKVERPKLAEAPKPAVAEPPKTVTVAPPPAVEAPVSVAPAPVSVAAFEFDDGAKGVVSGDAISVFKGLVERALRSNWNRPENLEDDKYVAEVELTVNPDGKVEGYRWLTGSGSPRWDDSVRAALAQTSMISGAPPKGFPSTFTVRFDVEFAATEEGMQLSSR
jgi:TonB family protein